MPSYYLVCIKEEFGRRLKKNARYSLRSFARALDIDGGALSRILAGQKIPTPEIAEKILSHLPLSSKDAQRFMFSIAQTYEERGVQRKKKEIRALLDEIKNQPSIAERDLTPEIFSVISDWHHYAILQLTETKAFRSDPRWIARQLDLPEMEAKLAIDRLLNLELLTENKGKWVRSPERLTTGDLRITTPAFRKRIKQVSEKSVHSLENDPIAERNHTTLTVAIDPARLPEAKEMIQAFTDRLGTFLGAEKKRVYELQINLFPLQRSEK